MAALSTYFGSAGFINFIGDTMLPISINPNVTFGHSERPDLTERQVVILKATHDKANGHLSTLVSARQISDQLKDYNPEEIYKEIEYLADKNYLVIVSTLPYMGESIPVDIQFTSNALDYIRAQQK
jgi:hypothetical protein